MAKKPDKITEIEGRSVATTDQSQEIKSLQIRLAESEFDSQVALAHRYPRNINRACDAMYYMATKSEKIASEMYYAVPRGGKTVEGPSIRFAEIARQSWGNCQTSSRVVNTNREEKYVEAEGVFIDIETNVKTVLTERRRIFDREGRIYSEDQIVLTGKAACAIAVRNAITQGIPRAAWGDAYEAARNTAAGTHDSLPKKRQETLQAFSRFDVSPDKVLYAIGVKHEKDLTLDHIATLRGMWSALKSGEASKEEMFAPAQAAITDGNKKAKKASLDDIAKGDDDDMKNLNARHEAIESAKDAGSLGFHKGLTGVPVRFAEDKELSAAWLAGWKEAKSASGEDDDDATEAEEDEAGNHA